MGIVIVDNRNAGGTLGEWDTVACKHCRAVIKVVIKGITRAYNTTYRCGRCCGPVCKACAEVMHQNGGSCTEPFLAKVELALKRQQWLERINYHYRTS